MSKKAEVYNNGKLAGYLEKTNEGTYIFQYDSAYYQSSETSAISLTLPKTQMEFHSKKLFPFFFGLLSEGINKQTQCRLLKVDESDHFELLLKTGYPDTIGAITVKAISS